MYRHIINISNSSAFGKMPIRLACIKCKKHWRVNSIAEINGNNNLPDLRVWETNSLWNISYTVSCSMSDKEYRFREVLK